MHSSFVLFLFFLFAVPMSFALPTNSTLHYLSKRDLVCGQNFRDLVDAKNCLAKGVSFTQSGATVTKATGVHKTVPIGEQCDHVIEIQILNKLLTSRGICTALSKVGGVVSTPSAATLLIRLGDIMSSAENINFLTGAVNNRKKGFTSGNSVTAIDDNTKAVKSYLKQTKTETKDVAARLDAEITSMVTQITTLSNNNPPAPVVTSAAGRKQRQSTQDVAKAALKSAVGKLVRTPSVVTEWNTVLADAEK